MLCLLLTEWWVEVAPPLPVVSSCDVIVDGGGGFVAVRVVVIGVVVDVVGGLCVVVVVPLQGLFPTDCCRKVKTETTIA